MTGIAIVTMIAVYFSGQISPKQTMIVVITVLVLVLLSPFVKELQVISTTACK